MEKFIYYLNNENPKNISERLLKLLTFIVMSLLCVLTLAFLICYFIFGLFLLDGLYYIITGNTIVAKHL